MKPFPMVILGGPVVAGYAAKECVAQSVKNGELAVVTEGNALPYARAVRDAVPPVNRRQAPQPSHPRKVTS